MDDVKFGDVVVTDHYGSGGSTSWSFRKIDGKWTQITSWGDIH